LPTALVENVSEHGRIVTLKVVKLCEELDDQLKLTLIGSVTNG